MDLARRWFVKGLAIAGVVAPTVAAAQTASRMWRIGVLAPGTPPLIHFDAFRQALRDLGYVEGQSLVLETRWDEGRPERYPLLADDLVRRKVDVILAGTTQGAVAAKKATQTIPIVMAAISDPVGSGLVASLARPGGNVTGMSVIAAELSRKRIEILKESVPSLARVAVLWNPNNPVNPALMQDTQAAGRALGVQLQAFEIRKAADIDEVVPTAAKSGAQAILLLQDSMFTIQRARIADLALKHRLPTISAETGFAASGGLINYGPNIVDSWRLSAGFVDKILRGAKPADLPVEQPTKLELVINTRTAKAVGLTIPPSLLLRADQVIE